MSGRGRRDARRRRTAAAAASLRDLQGQRRRLTRWMVVLGAAVLFFVLVSLVVDNGSDPATPEATPTAPADVVATTGPGPASTTSPEPEDAAAPPTDRLRHPEAQPLPLVRTEQVIDGDTLDVIANGVELRVRVFGIDSPERDEACYGEARDRLIELAGEELRLRVDDRQQDGFGRELRYLYTPDGASIDATLVIEGLARAWRGDGALRDELLALEDEARAAGTGCLWGR
ncbi:MAG: hypothetical protein GEU80_14755 [Dehalococcoidia bacterium]|nr:hypothetical protein [Dehalococcoidia bacterium]